MAKDDMQGQIQVTESAKIELERLNKAFERFSTVGQRLEEKYALLSHEAEILRDKLNQKEEEVKRAEKLATLGETAAALAHEVRNPLGAIKLFISLLRQDLSDRPESVKLVDQIDNSISVLDGVVSNILQFAKEGSLQCSPTNIHSLISEKALHFTRLMEKGETAISLDLQGNPFIEANEQGIRQVLYNILLNSCQATKYKGQISIKTRDLSSVFANASGNIPIEGIEIEISDNGPGIQSALLEKIFDPFVTGRTEGTGLGLAIVKKIVAQHGGAITATNNGGATFTIKLPRRLDSASMNH